MEMQIKMEEDEMSVSSSDDFEDYTSDEPEPVPPGEGSDQDEFEVQLEHLQATPVIVASTKPVSSPILGLVPIVPILPTPQNTTPIFSLSPILLPQDTPILPFPTLIPHSTDIDIHSLDPRVHLGPSLIISKDGGMGSTPVDQPTFGLIQAIKKLKFYTFDHVQSVFNVRRGRAAHLWKNGFVYVSDNMLVAENDTIDAMLFQLLPPHIQKQVTSHSTCLVRVIGSDQHIPPHKDADIYGPGIGLLLLSYSDNIKDVPALEYCKTKAEELWDPCIELPHQKESIMWMWGNTRHDLHHRVRPMPAHSERISVTFRIWMQPECVNQRWNDV